MHIALLGDSIFDNAAYTRGEPDVVTHLRARLPAGATATLLARDGARSDDIAEQVAGVPRDVSHVVLSVGGNDAIASIDLLTRRVSTIGAALLHFEQPLVAFERSYGHALDAVASLNRPTCLCTIYNGSFEGDEATMIRRGLALFNDVIVRHAFASGAGVIELRHVCTGPADYANPIEPSGEGGLKIAQAIADFFLRNPRIDDFLLARQ